KDFGQNWVKLRVAATSATSGIPTNDINNSDIPVLGGVGGFAAQGNYDMAIAVDPQNPNVIYVGGTLDGPPTGLIRVDTTFVHDAHSLYTDDLTTGDALRINIGDAVVLKGWPNGA